jgi:hypothetical protein
MCLLRKPALFIPGKITHNNNILIYKTITEVWILHPLIHSFESCFHAQGRQLVQLYGAKFVAVTYSTSRCEMTSLRAIYRHLGLKIQKEVWISKSKNDRQRSTKYNTQNPLKPVVNSGVPEVLASPAPYVTSVVVLLRDTYIIWFKK